MQSYGSTQGWAMNHHRPDVVLGVTLQEPDEPCTGDFCGGSYRKDLLLGCSLL